jgi:hypothetical protein
MFQEGDDPVCEQAFFERLHGCRAAPTAGSRRAPRTNSPNCHAAAAYAAAGMKALAAAERALDRRDQADRADEMTCPRSSSVLSSSSCCCLPPYSFSKADPKRVVGVAYIGGDAALLFAVFLLVRGSIVPAVSIGLFWSRAARLCLTLAGKLGARRKARVRPACARRPWKWSSTTTAALCAVGF